jgi:hypothetical protein
MIPLHSSSASLERQMQLCQLCQRRPAESLEHIPTRSSDNAGPVSVRYLQLADHASSRHHELSYRNGFARRSLCRKCNNETGSKYGQAYADFINQFTRSGIIEDQHRFSLLNLRGIYPQRILKQLYAIFLSIQPNAGIEQWRDIRAYVLKRNYPFPDSAPRVYLYRNISRRGRIVPLCGISELFEEKQPVVSSEMSYPPLGVVFGFSRPDYFSEMADITQWSNYGFKDRGDFQFRIPRLLVETDWPLGYGTAADVDRWTNARGIVWFVVDADDKTGPTSVSMLLQRDRNQQ